MRYDFSDDELKDIENSACLSSYRRSNKEFIEELKIKNSYFENMEIMTEYVSNKYPVQWKCKKCGEVRISAPSDLLKGMGCGTCKGKAASEKRSFKLIVNNWKDSNPTGNPVECAKNTGICKATVYKWWNYDSRIAS